MRLKTRIYLFILTTLLLGIPCYAHADVVVRSSTKDLPHCVSVENANRTLDKVVKLTGFPEKDLVLFILKDEKEFCQEYADWGGKGDCHRLNGFAVDKAVYVTRFTASRRTLAHEFTHCLSPRLPEEVREIIPIWVAK